jgi:FdrA protein
MSEVVVNEIRQGFYLDSVALMRLSREVAAMDGVIEAALMMATPANLAIMREAGLLDGEPEAQGNNLMLALRASSEAAGRAALDAALRALERPKDAAGAAEAWRPRSIAAAVKACPTPIWRSSRCRAPLPPQRRERHCGAASTSSCSATTCRSRTKWR